MSTTKSADEQHTFDQLRDHANLVLDMLLAQLQQKMLNARSLMKKNLKDLRQLQNEEHLIRSTLEQSIENVKGTKEIMGLDTQDMIFFNKMCFSRFKHSEHDFLSLPQPGTGASESAQKKKIIPFQSQNLMSEVISQYATTPVHQGSPVNIPELVNIPKSLVATAVSSLSSGPNSMMSLLKKFDHLYNNKDTRINQLLQEQQKVNVILESSRKSQRETAQCLATDWEEKTRPGEFESSGKSNSPGWMFASMGKQQIRNYEAYTSPQKSELQSEYASGSMVQRINVNLKTSAFNSVAGTPAPEYGSVNSRYHDSRGKLVTDSNGGKSTNEFPDPQQFESGKYSQGNRRSVTPSRVSANRQMEPKLVMMQASSGGQGLHLSTVGGKDTESCLKPGHINSQTRKLVVSYLTEVIKVGEEILDIIEGGMRSPTRSKARPQPEKEAHLTEKIRSEVGAKVLSLKASLVSVMNIGARKEGLTNDVLFEKLAELAKFKVPRAVQNARDAAEKEKLKQEEEYRRQKKITTEDTQNFWTRNYSPYKSRQTELEAKTQKDEEEYQQLLMYRSEYLNRVKPIQTESHVLQFTETFEMRKNMSKKSMTEIKNKDEKIQIMKKTSRSRSPWTLEGHRKSMQKKFEKTSSKINTGLNTPDGERSRSVKNLRDVKDIVTKPLLRRKEPQSSSKKDEKGKIQPKYGRSDIDKQPAKYISKMETPVKSMGFAQPTLSSECKLTDTIKGRDTKEDSLAKSRQKSIPREISNSVSRLSKPKSAEKKPQLDLKPKIPAVLRDRSIPKSTPKKPAPVAPKPKQTQKPPVSISELLKVPPVSVAPIKFGVVETEIQISDQGSESSQLKIEVPVPAEQTSEQDTTNKGISQDNYDIAKLVGPMVIALTDECSPDYVRAKPFVPSFMIQKQAEDKEKDLELPIFGADCGFEGFRLPRITVAGNLMSLEQPKCSKFQSITPCAVLEHPEVFNEAESDMVTSNCTDAAEKNKQMLEDLRAGRVVEVLAHKAMAVSPPPPAQGCDTDEELQLEDDSLELS